MKPHETFGFSGFGDFFGSEENWRAIEQRARKRERNTHTHLNDSRWVVAQRRVQGNRKRVWLRVGVHTHSVEVTHTMAASL